MKLSDRSMLFMEGVEWPTAEEPPIDPDELITLFELIISNCDVDTQTPQGTAECMVALVESYMTSRGKINSDFLDGDFETIVDYAESDATKDTVIDLMVRYPELSIPRLAEHMFVSTCLMKLLS